MTISVPAEFETYVQDAVSSGIYSSPEDVLREALRMHREHSARSAQLRADIQLGLDALQRGEYVVVTMLRPKPSSSR